MKLGVVVEVDDALGPRTSLAKVAGWWAPYAKAAFAALNSPRENTVTAYESPSK